MTFRCFRAAVAVSWVLFFNAASAPSARPRYEVMPAEGSQGGVSAIHGITPQQLDAVLAETLSAELLMLPSRRGVLAFPRCCENLTASEFLRISRLFGGKEVVSRHVVHPSSPSEDILRLSNQAEHGVVQVGPQWHQDGSTEKAVFSHLLLHALRPGAPTHFADLAKAYEVLEPETQEQWSRMASVNAYSGAVHPLVHRHPITGQKVLFLHLGQTGALISWNSTASSPYPDMEGMVPGVSLPEPGYRTLSAPEAAAVMSRYDALLNRPEVHFQHRYEAGDLLLVDNLAVAHRADAAAQNAGGALRLLHRSTVRGVRNVHAEGLPSFLYIFGDNPDCEGSESGLEGLWQSADYYGVGFKWNNSQHFRN